MQKKTPIVVSFMKMDFPYRKSRRRDIDSSSAVPLVKSAKVKPSDLKAEQAIQRKFIANVEPGGL
jgi:hypothetical protein